LKKPYNRDPTAKKGGVNKKLAQTRRCNTETVKQQAMKHPYLNGKKGTA